MEEAIKLHWLIPGLDEKNTIIVLMILLDMLIIIGIVAFGTLARKMKPNGPQNLVEWAVKYICDYADSVIGEKDAPRYYPLLVMLFFFIFVGNLLGLIPGLISPTSSLSVTVTLAVGVWLYTWFEGLTRKGPVKYFAHYTGSPSIPMAIRIPLFFIELISDFSRMISLSFRLFGNIVAKEVLLGVLVLLILMFGPDTIKSIQNADMLGASINGFIFLLVAILRPLVILLGVLVSLIQAGVFTLLTATYISGAVVVHDEHEHEGHESAH